jgi:hypothetical protein
MRLKDVVNHLFILLPTLTDLFSETLAVSSLTSSGTTATLVTTAAHGLSTNDFVNVSGSLVPNLITTLTQVANIASATTSNNHDLTQGFQETITISGATEADYNGTKTLLTVDNRKNFTYEITGNPSSPATGSPELLEDLKFGYDGWHQIIVIDPTTFTFVIPQVLGSPAEGTIKCKVRTRVTGIISLEKALASYTKQNTDKLWAFVVLGNRVANKDRQANTDATSTPGQGNDFRQLVIQPLSIYVVIPAIQQIGAREARDKADELLPILCNTLLRKIFPSGFVQPSYSGLVFSSDNFGEYNNAVYVHEFIFESTEYITYGDTFLPDFGTAFRDIDSDYLSAFTDKIIMTDHVDLDNVPL